MFLSINFPDIIMSRKNLTEKEIDFILEGDTSDEDANATDDEGEYDDLLERIQRQIESFNLEDEIRDELELAGEHLHLHCEK